MILIISNNPLSLTNSNGRTISNMLLEYDKNEIVNLFINGNPDYNLCSNFIKISDRDAFLGKIEVNPHHPCSIEKRVSLKKSITKVWVRELLWNRCRFYKKLEEHLHKFDIEDIFIQLGDYSFILNLAIKIAKDFSARLITFNTEDYCFKNWDYYKRKRASFLFKLHQNYLKKSYKKIYLLGQKNIFLTEELETIHKKQFNLKSSLTIYNSTEFAPQRRETHTKIISYCGNLNPGRESVLLNIAKLVNKIDKNYRIDVYSSNLSKFFLKSLNDNKNICYKGFVDYSEVVNVIQESFLNLSIDGFDDYSLNDYRHAFSTKTADLVSSGNRSLFIVPEGTTTFNYIKENECAYLCGDLNQLEKCLRIILNESRTPYKYFESAKQTYLRNHSAINNSLLFKEYIASRELVGIDFLVTTINKNKHQIIELLRTMNVHSNITIRSQNGTNGAESINLFSNVSKIIYSSDKGLSINRNALFNNTNSEYVLFMDDDLEFAENNYLFRISNSIINLGFPDAIEFSFRNEGRFIKRKNNIARYHKNSKFGVWFMLVSRKKIVDLFGNQPFCTEFGPGALYSCGEDSIFRTIFYKKYKRISNSNYLIGYRNRSESTWFKGKTSKYFLDRSTAYGFMHPKLYVLYLLKMKMMDIFSKNCSLLKCFKSAKEGKRIRLVKYKKL